jgi:hypothetical protein
MYGALEALHCKHSTEWVCAPGCVLLYICISVFLRKDVRGLYFCFSPCFFVCLRKDVRVPFLRVCVDVCVHKAMCVFTC